MTKREEMSDPASTWNKVGMDEPVFILRAQDRLARLVILDWIDRARRIGVNLRKVNGVHELLGLFEDWRSAHGSKTPD